MTLVELFTSIADAIRSKTGSGSAIPATEFPARIRSIAAPVAVTVKNLSASETLDFLYPDTENGNNEIPVLTTQSFTVPVNTMVALDYPSNYVTVAESGGIDGFYSHAYDTGNPKRRMRFFVVTADCTLTIDDE